MMWYEYFLLIIEDKLLKKYCTKLFALHTELGLLSLQYLFNIHFVIVHKLGKCTTIYITFDEYNF